MEFEYSYADVQFHFFHMFIFGDGTSFNDLTLDVICKELLKLGYQKEGNEIFDPNTGIQETLTDPIYVYPHSL